METTSLRRTHLPDWQPLPGHVLWFSLILSVLTTLVCLDLARQQPWLGLTLSSKAPDRGLHVLETRGPAAQLPLAGKTLTAIGLPGEEPLVLQRQDIVQEPDIPLSSYADYQAFFLRQQQLAALITAPELHLYDSNGRQWTLQPQATRPVTQLPLIFWVQQISAIGCWLVGSAIWAFRRQRSAAPYLLLTGFGALVTIATASIYSARELALPGALFQRLSLLHHSGSLLTWGAFVAVVCHHPRRWGPAWLGPAWVLAFVLIALLDWLALLPFGNRGHQAAILVAFASAVLIATRQWLACRHAPLERAAMQWFLLSWFVGSGGFLVIVMIPAMAGVDTSALQAYSFLLLLLIALGLALGIARYRLFDLDIWWFRAIALVVGAASVVLLDLLLVWWLDISQSTALALALALSGWLYFPLRQWLMVTLFRRMGLLRNEDILPLLLEVIDSTPRASSVLLPKALERLFAPLQLDRHTPAPAQTALADNGLALLVPPIDGNSGWRVAGPAHGSRLFSHRDVKAVTVVHAILTRMVHYQQALENSVEQERDRVTQDLHDDVGARLLTLLHQSDTEQAEAIREVLASLRLVIRGLGTKPQPLDEALAEWRTEVYDRCEAAGIPVQWRTQTSLPDWQLDASTQMHLTRILREATSNALRHARLAFLSVTLRRDDDALVLSIAHDGARSHPRQWRAGQGLNGMRNRTRRLGYALTIEGDDGGHINLEVHIPPHSWGGKNRSH